MTALGIDREPTLTAVWTPPRAAVRRRWVPWLALAAAVVVAVALGGWLGWELARAVAVHQVVSGG